MAEGVTTIGQHSPDDLFAGDFPVESIKVNVVSAGVDLTRGACLGRKTVGGDYLLSLEAAVDGSQVITAILAEPIADADLPAECVVYRTGEFNEDRLQFGTGHAADDERENMRDKSIFIKKIQAKGV